MTFLDKLKKNGMFESNVSEEAAVSFFYQHRIYISDLEDEENVSEELKEIARDFLENDKEYDGDERSAWSRLLALEVKN